MIIVVVVLVVVLLLRLMSGFVKIVVVVAALLPMQSCVMPQRVIATPFPLWVLEPLVPERDRLISPFERPLKGPIYSPEGPTK